MSHIKIFVRNVSHSTKTLAKYYHKYIKVSIQSTRYSCQILRKLEFSRHIFEKYTNTKFHANPSICPMLTDRRTGMAKLIDAFRNFANAPYSLHYLQQHVIYGV
jgi:hypothetical protein